MKILLLALVLALPNPSQKSQQKESEELKALRIEFVKATSEYKQSLQKLISIYEGNIKRAEEKLELSKKLASENLVSYDDVEEIQRQLAREREKVEGAKKELTNADKQIADGLDETKFAQEYKRAVQQRRKARKPQCLNWTLTVYQRTTSNSVSFGYRFVCH